MGGGFLLLHTGNKRFRELLPWLLLFAAVMFVLSFRWEMARRPSGGKRYKFRSSWAWRRQRLCGYFGAVRFLAMRCSASAASTTSTR